MTRVLPVLCIPFLAAATVALGIPQADAQAASETPAIWARIEGSRSVVFESLKDSCNQNDIPDSMARAFRDFSGTVHLVASSSEMFQNLGPTLEDVHHGCQPGFELVGDPDPANYNDQVWLSSFYTFDGVLVAALSHTEYHGWTHPGECNTQNIVECEYDSDTFHLSRDGGYHFESLKAPKTSLRQFLTNTRLTGVRRVSALIPALSTSADGITPWRRHGPGLRIVPGKGDLVLA